MLLRPIDAIFVHPKRRLYVIYYRGDLWQLPRMKIDMNAWQRKQTYTGSKEALHLSRQQVIQDPILAQKLRTLDLPMAIRGCTLPRFEMWWKVNGYEWLKARIDNEHSPLAVHNQTTQPEPVQNLTIAKINSTEVNSTTASITDAAATKNKVDKVSAVLLPDDTELAINAPITASNPITSPINTAAQAADSHSTMDDIFADMLSELASEVAAHRLQ